jgi:hypothetical protein
MAIQTGPQIVTRGRTEGDLYGTFESGAACPWSNPGNSQVPTLEECKAIRKVQYEFSFILRIICLDDLRGFVYPLQNVHSIEKYPRKHPRREL